MTRPRGKVGWFGSATSSPVKQHCGRVAWFNNALRCGFLSQEDGPDVFCRFDAIRCAGFQTLIQGEAVEYEIAESFRGPVATNVRRRAAQAKVLDFPPR